MGDIPSLALSVRQPWAWAIVHAGKDIENRSWRRPNPGLVFRGEFAVHAAKGMTRDEYEDARAFMSGCGVNCPPAAHLLRGGIIGVVKLCDIVSDHPSPWFMGPRGLVLSDARSTSFVPSAGQLGFFAWFPTQIGGAPAPAKWMLDELAGPASTQPVMQGQLF